MATVIASEAKLVVRLDTKEAERAAANLPVAGPGTAPAAGGAEQVRQAQRPPSEPTDGPGVGRSAKDMAYAVGRHGWGLTKTAWGGGLYEQVKSTAITAAGAIPVAGPLAGAAYRAAEINREYGPIATQALLAGVKHIDDPTIRQALQMVLEQVDTASRTSAEALDKMQNFFDTIGETVQELKEMAGGAAALGGMDPVELVKFGGNAYSVNQFLANEQSVKRRRSRMFQGQAYGEAGGEVWDRMFGGRSGR